MPTPKPELFQCPACHLVFKGVRRPEGPIFAYDYVPNARYQAGVCEECKRKAESPEGFKKPKKKK